MRHAALLFCLAAACMAQAQTAPKTTTPAAKPHTAARTATVSAEIDWLQKSINGRA